MNIKIFFLFSITLLNFTDRKLSVGHPEIILDGPPLGTCKPLFDSNILNEDFTLFSLKLKKIKPYL